MAGKTRSWWGWGNLEDSVQGVELDALLGRVRGLLPDADLTFGAGTRRQRPASAAAAGAAAGRACGAVLDRRRPIVPGTRTARRSATSCAALPATCATCPTWSSRPRRRAGRGRRARLVRPDAASRLIPYGGGSSVVGGVEPRFDGDYAGAVSLDLGRLDRVLEIDRTSRAARIQAGVLGPALEDQLRPHGLTLRHFPQSLRVLDARRLARDPLGRALRHALHAHRRPRRVDARGHARPASSESRRLPGLGRRSVARPAVPRLGRDPRRHHRGVDAAAGPPALAGLRRASRFADYDARRRRRARGRAGGAVPGQLPAARPRARR